MDNWHTLCITDSSLKVFFYTQASPMSTASEIKNLTRHLDNAKAGVKGYEFIDAKTAQLYLDGTPYMSIDDILDDDLLAELLGE